MKILAGLIKRQLRLEPNDFGHCAVYENELQRIWPITEENRKAKIAEFAKEHGFQLVYYKQGALRDLCRRLHRPRHQNSRKSRTA